MKRKKSFKVGCVIICEWAIICTGFAPLKGLSLTGLDYANCALATKAIKQQ